MCIRDSNNFGEIGVDPTFTGKQPFLASNNGGGGGGPVLIPPAGLESLDIAQAADMVVNGNELILNGTERDDTFEVEAGLETHRVSINQVVFEYDASEITRITIRGAGGQDKVELVGSALDDRVVLMKNSAKMTSDRYEVDIKGTEHISARGGEGNDLSLIHI